MYRKIEIVPYDPEWPTLFKVESEKIKKALGNNYISLDHIGSTSVPGLAAKPKIDLIAAVQDPPKSISQLETIGIQYRGEYNIPLHYGFSKRGAVDLNLHVYEKDHPEIELNLLFRNYLRQNTEIRDEYAKLKQTLLKDPTAFEKKEGSLVNYTLRKGDFIRSVLKKAGFNRIRLLRCNDQTEWNAAQQYRQQYFSEHNLVDDPEQLIVDHPNHQHFILYQGTEIIGYAHVELCPQHRALIHMMILDKNKRNQDFNLQFTHWIEKWLATQGYKDIQSSS